MAGLSEISNVTILGTGMRTFSETVQPIIARHSTFDLRAVLELLGAEVKSDLSTLDPQRRAALVDRLVRNLRGMSVTHGPSLERDLLKATGAEPSGIYQWELTTATALVDLRSGLRYLGTWLGYEWAALSRLQAVVSGLARWVQGSGTGTLEAAVEPRRVRFALRLTIPGHDVKTVEASAFVVAVKEVADAFEVGHEDRTVVVRFELTER